MSKLKKGKASYKFCEIMKKLFIIMTSVSVADSEANFTF